ncbi:MAG: hypothetical protein JXL67_08470 [Calditrichaeota bacterium]|nr:hypothetical protein [Calditrichota bacterium]
MASDVVRIFNPINITVKWITRLTQLGGIYLILRVWFYSGWKENHFLLSVIFIFLLVVFYVTSSLKYISVFYDESFNFSYNSEDLHNIAVRFFLIWILSAIVIFDYLQFGKAIVITIALGILALFIAPRLKICLGCFKKILIDFYSSMPRQPHPECPHCNGSGQVKTGLGQEISCRCTSILCRKCRAELLDGNWI